MQRVRHSDIRHVDVRRLRHFLVTAEAKRNAEFVPEGVGFFHCTGSHRAQFRFFGMLARFCKAVRNISGTHDAEADFFHDDHPFE